jgi:hypothetical protein
VLKGEWRVAADAILAYGRARSRFRAVQAKLGNRVLSWNDNLVGVAGEFWACVWYQRHDFKVEVAASATNPDYDFIVRKGRRKIKVSVKSMSDEARSGRFVRVPARGDWNELCVLSMSRLLEPRVIGIATKSDYARARRDGFVRKADPKVSPRVISPRGWMGRYGKVWPWQ